MSINKNNLSEITENLRPYKNTNLMIVTKNQSIQDIKTLLADGFRFFGENRVKEARQKYEDLQNYKDLKLHMIGPLQTNKVKIALKIFDTIQTLDRYTLVDEVDKVLSNNTCKTKEFYIQVNIGDENQKSGVPIKELPELYNYCLKKKLNIVGLMCIPPNVDNPSDFFETMKKIRDKMNRKLSLSMGMSNDYKIALNYESNIVRVGSLIFS